MFSRKSLKNYGGFHFIYNGVKVSYDSKAIFTCLPIYLSTYFTLINEKIDSEEVINTASSDELKKYLRNNVRAIPSKQTSIRFCLILSNYFLTHNDTYENVLDGSVKKLKKLYDHQFFQCFKGRVAVLRGLQIILFERNIVGENSKVLCETLTILNNYLALRSPALANEVFKVYLVMITKHQVKETLDIINTSLSMFYYLLPSELQQNVEAWSETIPIFLSILREIILTQIKGAHSSDHHNGRNGALPPHIYYYMNMMLSYLFSGLPNLQAEASRALKMTFQGLLAAYNESEGSRSSIEDFIEKIISLLLNKLNDTTPQDIKLRITDLIISIEQILKTHLKEFQSIFEEATLIICKDSDLVRVYLFNLRTLWRTSKQIGPEVILKIMTFVKCSFDQMQARQTLSPQDNELISEVVKIFIYLQFEGPNVNKNALPQALLSFILIAIDLKVNQMTTTVITQLMQHLYSNLPAAQVKQMLNTLNEDQKKILCQVVPILQAINEQKIEVQQSNAGANVNDNATAKPAIKLKTFGKK